MPDPVEDFAMPQESQSDQRILPLFSTPLMRVICPDSEATNRGLKQLILDKESTEPGQDRSNVGGWHSLPDLLLWQAPEIETLKGWITSAVKQVTQITSRAKGEVSGKIEMHAWANVSRRGAYNKIHHHPNHTWSGIYYVAIGDSDSGWPESGILEFLDPRFGVDMLDVPGNPFGGKVRVEPAPGMLLLFPSWLYHYVNPYQGDGIRMSIAFNVRVTEAQEKPVTS
ncbi:MAG: 2OG-Fe(II) oxygenase family protein [Alphaproteobacteria bacterium]